MQLTETDHKPFETGCIRCCSTVFPVARKTGVFPRMFHLQCQNTCNSGW